jgi:hypothetical protein
MTDETRLRIELECTRLQQRYAVYADHREGEKFTELFAEDGSVEVPDAPPFVGHDAIRASIEALNALPLTYRHVITNSVIDVVDEDHATGICYLVVFNSDASADESGARPMRLPSTVGEYHDTFRRTAKGWRIQTRRLERVFRNPEDPMRRFARPSR